jgi:hypothetical protein
MLCAILASVMVPVGVTVGQAAAVDVFSNCPASTAICTDAKEGQNNNANPIIQIISVAISVLSFIIGAAAIIGIIVSGLRLILANGDSNSVSSARSGLIYALVGIAIAIAARIIVIFVLDKIK